MSDHFAWAKLVVPDKTKSGAFITISAGEKVDKSLIGNDWNDFLAAGVIRTTKFPEDIRSDESPRNAILRKHNEEIKKLSEPFKHELEEDD